ncbi:MAG: SGNH/GDSL hydrolase family protein [Bacteroidaceae bacterium]|nr:SGNH/GDSL hydrolase family protein [Bacteroidaceae bacterium]
MKRILAIAAMVLMCCGVAVAQGKKVSILGDSYSTFRGHIPAGYAVWYPMNGNDVTAVEQTWWYQFINDNGLQLEQNNSYSGSTVCNTGYNGEDYSDRSFYSRINYLGNPDIILIFGCTNDSWAHSPIGEYQYSDWSKKDMYAFRPAAAYMLSNIKMLYPEAEIYYLLNSELDDAINESVNTVCAKYQIPVIALKNIDKQLGHPSQAGMKAISEQVAKAVLKK